MRESRGADRSRGLVVRTIRLSMNSCGGHHTLPANAPPLHHAVPVSTHLCVSCPPNPLCKGGLGLVLSSRHAQQTGHRGCDGCHHSGPSAAVGQPWVNWRCGTSVHITEAVAASGPGISACMEHYYQGAYHYNRLAYHNRQARTLVTQPNPH